MFEFTSPGTSTHTCPSLLVYLQAQGNSNNHTVLKRYMLTYTMYLSYIMLTQQKHRIKSSSSTHSFSSMEKSHLQSK